MKRKIFESARGKKKKRDIMYKGIPIRLTADFSAQWTRRWWDDIVQVLKGKIFELRILYPAKLSFKKEEITTFLEEQKQNLLLADVSYKKY